MTRVHMARFVLAVGAMAVLLGFAAWGTQTSAQPQAAASPTPSGRIATLDVVRIFNECAQIQDLNSMMKEEAEDFTKEASQRRKVIEEKQLELSAFKPGTVDFELRRKDLIRMNIEANVWLKVSEQVIEQEKFDWTRIVYENALQASAEMAREKGFEIVVQSTDFKPGEIEQNISTLRRVIQDRAVIYRSPQVDLTDAVIRRLDRDYQAAGGKKQLKKASMSTGVSKPQP